MPLTFSPQFSIFVFSVFLFTYFVCGVSSFDVCGFAQHQQLVQCDGKPLAPHHVNDEYCDCADGMDEPGTSACSPRGVFLCRNVGHQSMVIPSSRVRDGVCDCCDGSDESFCGVVASSCADTCLEVADKYAVERAARLALFEAAQKSRLKYVAKGKKYFAEVRQRLEAIPTLLTQKRDAVPTAEANAKAAEAAENQTEIRLAQEAHQKFEEGLKLGERTKDNLIHTAIRLGLGKAEESGEALVDLIVKTFEGIGQRIAEEDIDSVEALSLFMESKEDGDDKQRRGQREAELRQILKLDSLEAQHLQKMITNLANATQQQRSLVVMLMGEEDAKRVVVPQERERHVSLEAENARNALKALNDEIKALEERFEQAKRDAEFDYGAEAEFFALKGKCFVFSKTGNMYKLCPFDAAHQAHRRLGSWSRWVDAPFSHNVMSYTKGESAQCPNNKERSAEVQIQCGRRNKIIDVEEPEVCAYKFIFETPAACKE